eukprot:CAMPEP_0206537874 /NCGR_PEP_ID=MMETSP0325_2-20121206/7553_1 /ASSEMBLY_ACC=CAM_ASM_000347 /TAXON_ID=2866 /ORGANISM="Crypthecodinium cohnii, Strain Seligo" /LENGTH=458 /DNA_ID=CAMNT_0054035257 /DNA_START=583 /DNA_END=1959 /DNA_ORIENTATION=-
MVDAKFVTGTLTLEANKAQILSKFCFDFQKDCAPHNCSEESVPGHMGYSLTGARRLDGEPITTKPYPEVFVAMLDDEYFSFPEVSQIWEQANCSEVKRASKRWYPINWEEASGPHGLTVDKTNVVEHLRPRWWYFAIATCAPYGLTMQYRLHMENPLQSWQRELSMDVVGVGWISALLAAAFIVVALVQLRSALQWSQASLSMKGNLEDSQSKRGRYRRILLLHPAVLLLTFASVASAAGECSWFFYYWDLIDGSADWNNWQLVARATRLAGKTCLSILMMLLSRGQCVCTPDIAWEENREVVGGLVVFGLAAFGLETWGDSLVNTSTTEYVYDTRPGTILVAFDLVWFWLYVSRAFATWQAETRIKPRTFYMMYGFPCSLWFLALPSVAFLATYLAPWVRFKVTYILAGLTHWLTLSVLIHTFRPHVASGLYELSLHEYHAVRTDELDQLIKDDDFI